MIVKRSQGAQQGVILFKEPDWVPTVISYNEVFH